jgi:hypothetical protein
MIARINREEAHFKLVPDLRGTTALHISNKTYTLASEKLIELLGECALNHHHSLIKDILPDLIKSNPLPMCRYFDQRMKTQDWFWTVTNGALITAEEQNLGFFASSLIPMSDKHLEKKIFDSNEDDKEVKRLPLLIKVFDFPELHHFGNESEQALFDALAATDSNDIFDSKFVQALVEVKYPKIRDEIFYRQMMPYFLFLGIFCYYALVHFENNELDYHDDGHITMFFVIEGFIFRINLLALSLYFIWNEVE